MIIGLKSSAHGSNGPEISKNSLYFPCYQGKWPRDGFVTDCVRHHPVSDELTVRCTLPNSSDSSVACVVCSAQFQSHPRLCRCHFACNFGAVSGPRKHFPRFSFPIRRDWFVSGERRVRQFLACGSRCSNERSWTPLVTSHESLSITVVI